MNKTKCLIIEDEPLAAEVISDYIAEIPFLELIEVCSTATQGLGALKSNHIDLIFLDLHLPGMKGFDFIRTLRNPPQIIVTSAYQEYALEGYELDIVDYLLKPIDFQRFVQAINRLQQPVPRSEIFEASEEEKQEVMMLKQGRSKVPVMVSDITYVEGQRDYVLVFTDQSTIKTKSTLSAIEERLSHHDFVRIHKSFIVAKSAVTSFSRTKLKLKDKELPVGRKYAELVQVAFQP